MLIFNSFFVDVKMTESEEWTYSVIYFITINIGFAYRLSGT